MKPTTTSRGVTYVRPSHDEKTEQSQIANLVYALGGRAYVLGTRRAQYCGVCGARTTDQGTRQTEGLADLAVYLPPPPKRLDGSRAWVFVWIECKGKGGALTPEQVEFKTINERAHVEHVVGGVDAFFEFLVPGGWVKP